MSLDKKYSIGIGNTFNKLPKESIIQLGVVKLVGEIPVNNVDQAQRKRDEVFNSDPNVIRCRIDTNQYDQPILDDRLLPNCYPMLPKHLNVVPKVGEVVFIMLLDPNDRYSDRLYFGPIIGSREFLKEDRIDTNALNSLSISPISPSTNLSTLKDTKGVFPNIEDIALQGRDNSDIIFKTNEALLRAGQHIENNTIVFNTKNPAYLQLRFNTNIEKSGQSSIPEFSLQNNPTTNNLSGANSSGKKGSVINLVADKINLIGHTDTDRRYTITNNENYISEEEITNIIETAHPVAFGDTLLDYLKKLELAFMNHVHRFPGIKPSAVRGENYIKEYLEYNVQTILSKNVRIN